MTRCDIEAKVKAVRDALEGDDVDRIKSAMDELTQASHKMAEQMYQSSGESGAAGAGAAGAAEGGGASESGGGENVVDAEFEETQ